MKKLSDESQSLPASIQLVNLYQDLLRTMTGMLALGAPDTLLPARAETLRKAIRTMALSLNRSALDYVETLGRLRTAYLSLASFISYEEAHAAMNLQQAFARGDRKSMSDEEIEVVMARGRRIEQDAAVLAREFDHFAEDREASELLTEIDLLFAELQRNSQRKPDPAI